MAIASKGQQNIAQGTALGKRIPFPPKSQRPERAAEYTKGNFFLRHAQRPSLLGLCHAVENIGEANALRKEYRLNNNCDALPSNEAKHTLINLRNFSNRIVCKEPKP